VHQVDLAARLDAAASWSIALDASTTTSKASPALTRLAASTPPTDSMTTLWPVCRSNASTRSASTWRVAIDEIPVILMTPCLDECLDRRKCRAIRGVKLSFPLPTFRHACIDAA
jgi:hypothetical protein